MRFYEIIMEEESSGDLHGHQTIVGIQTILTLASSRGGGSIPISKVVKAMRKKNVSVTEEDVRQIVAGAQFGSLVQEVTDDDIIFPSANGDTGDDAEREEANRAAVSKLADRAVNGEK